MRADLAAPPPGSVGRPASERPDVPIWALAAGVLLVLAFAGLVVQTYAGRSLVGALTALVPGARSEPLADAAGSGRSTYPGSTVQIGQLGIGTRGQDRAFQAGDVVLLGATGRLVRLEESGRPTELRPAEGATLRVTGLGEWDPTAGGLAGLTARYSGGAWAIETPRAPAGRHQPVRPGRPRGGADRRLPARALRRRAGASVQHRRRPDRAHPAEWADGGAPDQGTRPLPTLDNVIVTIQATVRAVDGATVELALSDVLDEAGTVQRTADRRTATSEDEWMTLRVQRRVTFGSPNDRYSIGLVEVRNRDWLEIRELGVYLGVLP